MTRTASQEKKKSEQKSSSNAEYASQEDLFRGEGFYELMDELRYLDENHIQQLKDIDGRYEDIQNGVKLVMFKKFNKDEISIMQRKIKLLKKIDEILTKAETLSDDNVR